MQPPDVPRSRSKRDRSVDPGEGRPRDTRGASSEAVRPASQPHAACRRALDDPERRAQAGLPPARRQQDGWASRPTEMDGCAGRRQTGLLEPSITSCAVCKFSAPRCIGPIMRGWGRGRSLREGVGGLSQAELTAFLQCPGQFGKRPNPRAWVYTEGHPHCPHSKRPSVTAVSTRDLQGDLVRAHWFFLLGCFGG